MIQPYTLELFEFVSRYWLAELDNQLVALAEKIDNVLKKKLN